MIVTSSEQLRWMIKQYERYDSFVVDLETMYTPTEEEAERAAEIRAIPAKTRTIDDDKWLEAFDERPTDVRVNEVIWFGMATYGRADSIPTGHPVGKLLKPARKEKIPAFDLFGPDDERSYTKGGKPSYRGIQRAMPAEFGPPPQQLSLDEVIEALQPLFYSGRTIINQNLKFDLETLAKYFGGFPEVPIRDTIIEQHILNENLQNFELGTIVERHLGLTYNKLGKKGVTNFEFAAAALYAQQDARFTWLVDQRLMERIERHDVFRELFYRIEMPSYRAFMEMEYEGIHADAEMMKKLRREREKAIAHIIEQLIVDYDAPSSFNPNARQQVSDLLYDQYGAPIVKMTKGGKDGENKVPSVDAEALGRIAESDTAAAPVAQLLVDFADQNKVLGTYLVGMSNKFDLDGRIHPSFKLHGTVTGRPSCAEPNLQNIPRDDEMREIFYAPKGYVFVVGDYDQIELRFIGEYSGDVNMIKLFNSDVDFHLATAALVMGLPIDDPRVKKERTPKGKMPNFLIGYGGTEILLAKKTGISEEAAGEVMTSYFQQFRGINPWKARVLREARQRAVYRDNRLAIAPYVETWHGRRRRLPNLAINPDRAEDWKERKKLRSLVAEAERQAVNARIQGSAAEVTKIAMINIRDFVRAERYPMTMVLMVHDELITLVPERHADDALPLLNQLMSSVVSPVTGEPPMQRIPLVASCSVMDRWRKE